MSQLKRTPLYDEHIKLNAKMVDFAGWEMPIQYDGITPEHLAVRSDSGLFDVSHMGEIFVLGKDAEKYVQWIITGDITKLKENQILYTLLCYENGGIVDDLLIYKFSNEKYLFVVNASNTNKDYEWMLKNKKNFEVNIENHSDKYGQVALQGPNAQKVLQQLTDFNLENIKSFYFEEILVNGLNCIVSRTGYTGEDGFEIYSSKEDIVNIWQKLLSLGVKPIGLGARDTLRFEAGFTLYGNEIGEDITPLEAGLGFFVKLDTDFIGKEVLVKQKEEGLKRKLVGLKLLDKGICRNGYPVCDMVQNEIGYVTTGYLLPNHDKALAQALIDIKYSNVDDKILVKVRNRYIEAQIIPKKFIKK